MAAPPISVRVFPAVCGLQGHQREGGEEMDRQKLPSEGKSVLRSC